MTLYRVTYQATRAYPCRHITYAARDAEDACRIAHQWACGLLPLIVKPLHHLQPQLTLTGGRT